MTHSTLILSTLSRIRYGHHKEIAANCSLTWTQVNSCMRRMQRKGLVVDTGKRVVVNVKQSAIVWGVATRIVDSNELF